MMTLPVRWVVPMLGGLEAHPSDELGSKPMQNHELGCLRGPTDVNGNTKVTSNDR